MTRNMSNPQPPQTPPTPLSRGERWLQRAALILMVIFTGLGAYVLYYPSDLLIAIFGTMAVVVIALGAAAGIVAIYKS